MFFELKKNQLRIALHRKYFEYDTEVYPFKKIIESLFGCETKDLHKYIGNFKEFERSNDQNTLAHKVFYANYKDKIFKTYKSFVENEIKNIIKVPFYYQIIPTFRIGLPGNKFVGEYHKDSFYNHQSYEVNFNLGISGYKGNAALRSEKKPNTKEFVILECPYGKIFSFDHIDCLHGSEINASQETMVSFDFRIAIESLYFKKDVSSVNIKKSFAPGEYFSKELIN